MRAAKLILASSLSPRTVYARGRPRLAACIPDYAPRFPLFVSQCIDRVEPRGSARRKQAKHEPE